MSTLRPKKFSGLKSYIDRRMTIKHLRILTAIARYGKLSEAAQSLNTTTSNVSKTLKEIDEFVGERLFVRHHGLFKETERSRHLLKLANDIFTSMERAKEQLSQRSFAHTHTPIVIGYCRTLMSARAHTLWNKLVFTERSASVTLNRLSHNELRRQDNPYQEIDIILSSNDLRSVLHFPEWHITTRPLQDMVFIASEEHRITRPCNFFLPACSEEVTHILAHYVQKYYPEHESICYYDSLHSILDVLNHPGACIIMERNDSLQIRATFPIRVIQSITHHGLHYQAALNVKQLEHKGLLNKVETLLHDIAAIEQSPSMQDAVVAPAY